MTLAPDLIFYSIAICCLGTLLGLGGGFLFVPFFLIRFPEWTPAQVTATSLVVILFNAISATVIQNRQKRIDWKIAIPLFLAVLAPAYASTFVIQHFNIEVLKMTFGVLLLTLSFWLIYKNFRAIFRKTISSALTQNQLTKTELKQKLSVWIPAELILPVLTTTLGVGGGLYRVPALIHYFRLTPSMATATSTVVLIATSGVATAANLINHGVSFDSILYNLLLGALLGSFLGSKLALFIKGSWLQLLFSAIVFCLGLKMII